MLETSGVVKLLSVQHGLTDVYTGIWNGQHYPLNNFH